MDKLLFIINPKAGTSKIKSIQDNALTVLGNAYDIEVKLTEYAGHATELAQYAVSNNYFGVVAVGGDGSINEVAQALIGSNTVLGILPKGSGNGLARSLHIKLDMQSALTTILTKRVESIDVGKVNGEHYFLSNLGVGFDVTISKEFQDTEFRGFWGYSYLVTQHLLNYKPRRYKIKIDNQEFSVKAFLLNIANAEQFGFNFKIAPHADVQDGVFDIVAIQQFPLLESGFLLMDAFAGNLYNNKFVDKWKGSTIEIEHPKLKYYQVDGDLIKNSLENKIHVALIPQALKVFKP